MKWKNLLRRPFGTIGDALWQKLSATLPRCRTSISVCTYPDYDDTLRALQRAAAERSILLDVIVKNPSTKKPDWLDPCITRVYSKTSGKGIAAFHRSSATLFTHGLYSNLPLIDNRPTLNLWHGTPIKRIGQLDPRSTSLLPKSHWVIAENEFFRPIMAEAFAMAPSQVLIMEHPRLDVMMKPDPFMRWWPEKKRKLIVWLPTYRRSSSGEIRMDGGNTPIGTEAQMRKLDTLLERDGGIMLVKLHPMEAMDTNNLPSYQHIEFLDDEALSKRGLSLYQLIGNAEALVTDISSVLFDFRHTGRPIWVFFPDLELYEASRGFVAPLDQLIIEPILTRFDSLLERLSDFLRSPDCSPDRLIPQHADRAKIVLEHMLSQIGHTA